MDSPRAAGRLAELARLFLKLGVIGFGGPAAHIAMMEEEVVERRKWLKRGEFLDLVGATHLIPGPNSTEMAIHVGRVRAGFPGLLVSGACFILPAVTITIALAWVYQRFGTLPDAAPVLAGIHASVLAIIAGAGWRLGRKAVSSWKLATLGAAVLGASLLGLGEVLCLFAGGLVGAVWLVERRETGGSAPVLLPLIQASASTAAVAATPLTLGSLGLVFLKVGCVLYGSGYVLVAFLQTDLVERNGWMTSGELMDAIAAGQFTPGPILSTSAFIGYGLAGLEGALVASAAIFLPSFVFVTLWGPIIPKLRKNRWSAAFLDAVNVSAIGLMASVACRLGRRTLAEDLSLLAVAGVAVFAMLRFRLSAVWIVLGGGLAGWILLA